MKNRSVSAAAFVPALLAFLIVPPLSPVAKAQGTAAPSAIPKANIAEGTRLLPNPSFANGARGWLLNGAKPAPSGGRNNGPRVVLPPPVPGSGKDWTHVGVKWDAPPTGRALRFSVWARRSGGGKANAARGTLINAFAYDKNNKLVDHWSAPLTLAAAATPAGGKWAATTVSYTLPPNAAQFAIWILNSGAALVEVSDARLVAGKAAADAPVRALNGPGVIRASACAAVRPVKAGGTGVASFPIPGGYRDQIPLAFTLRSSVPGALKGYKWVLRPDNRNWVCEAQIAPPPKGCIVTWEALVLVRDRADAALPRAARPDAPDEARAWLAPTACVQSRDAGIVAQARALAKGNPDVATYARRVIAFTSANAGTGAKFDALDAKKALACGGSCTSRANLAAALLRAHGIPARTVSHLPTWADKLYEHWLVEYWHPGAGWVWLEPTLNEWEPKPYTLAVLSVSNPDDENKAFDPVHLRYIMPGAAYLSAVDLDKNLTAAETLFTTDATNWAKPVARLAGTDAERKEVWSSASAAWDLTSMRHVNGAPEPPGRFQSLLRAAQTGPAALAAACDAIAQGTES